MAKAKFTEVTIEGRKVKIRSVPAEPLPDYGETRVVGKPVRRKDALEKVTGRAVFPSDLRLAEMLHVRFVRSARAHARIVSVDVSAAQSLPGVLAIVTPEELAGKSLKDIMGRGIPILTDEPKYFGEELFAVCAETDGAARAAIKKIVIQYEDLPVSMDPEEQVKAGMFVGGGWKRLPLGKPTVHTRGDVRKGFAASDKIFERTYRTSPAIHSSIEPHACVAKFEDSRWTVWESTQGVFAVREELAEILGVSLKDIRVIGTYMGGGFGGKAGAGKHTVLAAYLSKKFSRPVRCVMDRREEFLIPYGRPPSIQEIKVGVRADGKIMAIEQKGIHAIGGYEFGAEWGNAEDLVMEMYACENARTETYAALTHTPPPCAMRAPGYVQGAFALEQMMDEIAQELKIDPVEFRLKNVPARDPSSGREFASPKGMNGLAECLRKGAEMFRWQEKISQKNSPESKTAVSGASKLKRGVGVAATVWSAGGGPPASAVLRIETDGTAHLFTGAADIGTGTRTVLAQIVSEEIGIPVESIRVTNADTDLTPYVLPSYGSLTLASSGPAVRRAAHSCRQQLIGIAADVLQTAEKNIIFAEGKAVRLATKKIPEESVPVARLVRLAPSREILGHGEREANPELSLKAFGAQFVVVDVDIETGQTSIAELLAVNDSGRVINRLTAESQQLGGATMGIGMAITEERVFDKTTGLPLNANFADYKIPTIMDQPEQFNASMIEVPFTGNIIGSKGLGEPPIIPTAPAIANAVAAALGTRVRTSPLSPMRVLDALYPKDKS